jgi:macrodomain Ter protein organizer (MatP/YcbG family)
MPEKREGQEIIRLYLPIEVKQRFKLYCQLRGETMTDVITQWIEETLAQEDFTKLVQKRLGK